MCVKYLKNPVANLHPQLASFFKSTMIDSQNQYQENSKIFENLAGFVLKQTVEKYKAVTSDLAASDTFIFRTIVNRADVLGNTMLHLAAWNNKYEMYDLLVELGADQTCLNNDGLTAFTLSARFGLWGMFEHIWKKHFTSVIWRFGDVLANRVDYQQFETITSGLTSFNSVNEIEFCIQALLQKYILNQASTNAWESTTDSAAASAQSFIDKKLEQRIYSWCEHGLGKFLQNEMSTATPSHKFSRKGAQYKKEELKHDFGLIHMKNALHLITLFRPHGWYNQTKDLIEEVVLSKWSQGYYLVHIGDSLVPYCILILLFCLMWWARRLSILEYSFWWATTPISAPNPNNGLEGTCGWPAIQESFSGRIQAVLIIYGVPSLIRLAIVQCRIRPSDLDENVDWKISTDEIINFMYLNLESILHFVIAGLFMTIGVARVLAGNEQGCHVWALQIEKSATSIAALGLFFNLFILCKPYKGFGLLVLTWYRFLLADVFNFLVMYCMIFLAFLIALQTLHNASFDFLFWMDQSETILPQVQAAMSNRYPDALPNLTYLVNGNPPSSNQLLSTNVALNGCLGNRRSIQDTAFSLLEISFGDGLADALEQARTRDFECAGFSPDLLIGYLLVFWVFLTNTLIMNMLISMMNHTFDKQRDTLSSVWLLDISKRVMRYENNFCELGPRVHRIRQNHSVFSRKYWLSRLEDLILVVYCIPEVHRIVLAAHLARVLAARYGNSYSLPEPDKTPENQGQNGFSWKEIKHIITAELEQSKPPRSCSILFAFANWLWRPHMRLVHNLHNTDEKVVVFGKKMETHKKLWGKTVWEPTAGTCRLAALIYRLELLKETMQHRRLKIRHTTASKETQKGPMTSGVETLIKPAAGGLNCDVANSEQSSIVMADLAYSTLPCPAPKTQGDSPMIIRSSHLRFPSNNLHLNQGCDKV
jgi:hypothetical protein